MTARRSLSALLASLLGVAAAVLVSCGSSTGKLIPVANAGPLQSDFEAVAQEAEAGNGSCSATEAAIVKTEQDFRALPPTVDAGLNNTLRQGIDNLRQRALALCVQPLAQTTAAATTSKTTTSTRTTTSTTTPTVTQTSPTSSTPTTTATAPPTSGSGGGTPAPGASESPQGAGENGGSAGGSGAGGAGVGGQEGGK